MRHYSKIRLLFVFFFLLNITWPSTRLASQESPYQLSTGIDIGLSTFGLLGSSLSIYLHKAKQPLSAQDIEQLDPLHVPRFERFVTNNWSIKAQHWSDVFLFSAPLIPSFLLLDQKGRDHIGKITLFTLQTYFVNAALTGLTKELVQRKRPFTYNPDVPLDVKTNRDASSSFFSGHTSFVAASWFLTAKVFHDLHPNSKLRPYVWAMAATVPAVTGFLRVQGGKHFITDVLVGYLIGASVGILVPMLHKKKL